MTEGNKFAQEITPILDREETQPKRSSSVGAALKRLFSRSPAPVSAGGNTSEASSSILGPETPETAAKRAGTRGRTPPKFVQTSSPLASTQDQFEISKIPPNRSYSLNQPPNFLTKTGQQTLLEGVIKI